MTADNPTVDDLRLVARNLEAEKQTSRALILNNAADKLERLEKVLAGTDPWIERGDTFFCRYCEHNYSVTGTELAENHKKDCIWLSAWLTVFAEAK